MVEIEPYEDPIIKLIKDPELNKEKSKTSQLIKLINSFPLTERKVSKLCHKSFIILQNLEKISLNLKNWEFMSLDINSNYHFNNIDNQIKDFNHTLAEKILNYCMELNVKLTKISLELDYVTKASKSLTPLEYMHDSGTMLTALILRNIKLKNELTDNLTVSYSKAKLILIGKDLELILKNSDDITIKQYKKFIINLLKQLNQAIEMEDMKSKYNCLAVMNDMEKMFDAFKLEKIKQVAFFNNEEIPEREDLEIEVREEEFIKETQKPTQQLKECSNNKSSSKRNSNLQQKSSNFKIQDNDYDYDYDSHIEYKPLHLSSHSQPSLIHSKSESNDSSSKLNKNETLPNMSTNSKLFKTTITDELPYLMSAFNSAKKIEEDISHFKEQKEESSKDKDKHLKKTKENKVSEKISENHFHGHKSNLPDTTLYSESTITSQSVPQILKSSTTESLYLYPNNSLLSKLGIRPQIITTEIPTKELNQSMSNISNQNSAKVLLINSNSINKELKREVSSKGLEREVSDKENKTILNSLTKNLDMYSIFRLNSK